MSMNVLLAVNSAPMRELLTLSLESADVDQFVAVTCGDEALDEFNQELEEEERLEKSTDTLLFGDAGKLDSLGLVSLVVQIEQEIEDEFGVSITIADERAMSQKKSPFKTIERLLDYISMLLEEAENG